MRYVLIGTLLSVIGVLLCIVIGDITMVTTITSGIGLIFIGVAALCSGALVSGDKMRANFATESADGRNQRNNIVLRCVLMAVPSFVVAILFYFLLNE